MHRPSPACPGFFPLRLLLACITLFVAPAPAQQPSDVFAVAGKPAREAFLVDNPNADPHIDPWAVPDVPMLRELAGVRAELTPRDLGRLRQAAHAVRGQALEPVYLATLLLRSGDATAAVTLSLAGDEVIAEQKDVGVRAALALVRAQAVLGPLQPPVGTSNTAQPQPGAITDLPGPYVASEVTLDTRTVRERIQPPKHFNYPTGGPTRRLDDEHMWVRLPTGYDPSARAGLVVWVSPAPDWRIPPQFAGVLDELGLIAVGVDNTGNQRPIVDRLQLQLDAVATASDLYRVDPARVYVTGFSGGGRCSSILVGAFPDRFAGALPIVGLDSPHVLPRDDGKLIAASFKRQRGVLAELVRTRRVFAITGSEDFNRAEMEERTRLQSADGVPIRLETVPGMHHTDMPPAELIAQGLRWIDEPRQTAAAEEEARARGLLDAYIAEHGAGPVGGDAARLEALGAVCAAFPWGEAAWKAAGILGFEKPEGGK